MPQTLAALEIVIRFMSSTGAGILASLLFTLLRDRTRPYIEGRPASPLGRAFALLFYAPRYSRITAIVLAGLVAAPFVGMLAQLDGRPVLPVVDVFFAGLVSQVWHAFTSLSPNPGPVASPTIAASFATLDDTREIPSWLHGGVFTCEECYHRFHGVAQRNEDGTVQRVMCPACFEVAGVASEETWQ